MPLSFPTHSHPGPLLMASINLTPDSFYEKSRVSISNLEARISSLIAKGADIIDIGAVSTRPGASDVGVEEEWYRLSPAMKLLAGVPKVKISIDTTSSEIVRRCSQSLDSFIVNDISAGEDDPQMLGTAASLGLGYIAMHKRGNSRTMDSLCDYLKWATEEFRTGVVPAILEYFEEFAQRANAAGLSSDWILDPGLGFAKNDAQCREILENLEVLKGLGHRVLVGTGDKRFTNSLGGEQCARDLATLHGADILRVHL